MPVWPSKALHRYAAGIIASVFQALQALDEDGDNIAGRYRADDAAHRRLLDGLDGMAVMVCLWVKNMCLINGTI
jgi:hypothetical protein